MINHTHTTSAEVNFSKLEDRIIAINDPIISKANEIRELFYQITVDGKPTLIIATGGSKVVAFYLQLIIERLGMSGEICEVIEPRDYFYKANLNRFSNLIAVSASGNTNGIKEALNDFNGSKFLICENKQIGDYEVISWGNELYEKEKSFISLSSSLGPMALMLDATTSLNMEIGDKELEIINDRIKRLMALCTRKINSIPFNFINTDLIQIMSGHDTKCSSSVLESNVTEAGLCSVVIHDKGSFCHGRSNLLFRYPNSHVIYLHHQASELDNILLDLLGNNYPNISVLDTNDLDNNYFWKEYYLSLQMYYLSKRIADDKSMDLTKPEYNPNVLRKLYHFKGGM